MTRKTKMTRKTNRTRKIALTTSTLALALAACAEAPRVADAPDTAQTAPLQSTSVQTASVQTAPVEAMPLEVPTSTSDTIVLPGSAPTLQVSESDLQRLRKAPQPADSYLKPGAPIRIQSEGLTLAPGQAGTLRVSLTADTTDSVKVDWTLPATLRTGTNVTAPNTTTQQIEPMDRRSRSLLMKRGVAQDILIDIPASTEGRHYVTVTATLDGAMRAISVPVQVGKGGPAMATPPGQIQTTPAGESIMVMDGEETINGVPVGD